MWLATLLLVLASVFFVAAEYSMVGARRNRLETLSRRGDKKAKRLLKELESVSSYVAGSQVGITMVGIGVGSVTEPFITDILTSAFSQIPAIRGALGPGVTHTLGFTLSFFVVSFALVVVGELCPKYFALRQPEQVAFFLYKPMRVVAIVFKPLIWMAETSASLILRVLRVDMEEPEDDVLEKEELLMLVRTGGNTGILDKGHAEVVTRALRLDVLDARDIMIHRLDIKWIDADLTSDAMYKRLKEIPFTRIPVCRGDIDEMVGLLYLHDYVRHFRDPNFSVVKICRPVVAIPENLPMEKIVETMRTEKTQMLIVMDEYGGTSGLVTLEDVVEEVFGELEDRLESDRPNIEELAGNRISARADVRFDELVERLGLPIDPGENTETVASMIVDALDHIPRPGDTVETQLGTMRVENMARRRITRVSIRLSDELLAAKAEALEES